MSESKALTNWEEKLAQYSVAATEAEAPNQGGSWLSTQGGHLTYQDEVIAGDKVSVIVIAAVHENQYYDLPWDPKKPRSPVCYAFAEHEADLRPHPECEAPQAENCADCEKNQWPKTKGEPKPCKNVRRLALIPAMPDMDEKDIAQADPAWLKVPVMSVKNWSSHTRTVATDKRPPWAVVTRVGVIPDKKSQFQVTFEYVQKIASELLGALEARHIDMQANLGFPYRRNEETAEEVTEEKAKKDARFK